MPTADSAFAFVLAWASVTWPINRVPLRRTTCPSCFTSCVVFATTRCPGWHLRASSVVSNSALIAVPDDRLAEDPPALADAEPEFDAEADAAPCAPLCLSFDCAGFVCFDCACCRSFGRYCWSADCATAAEASATTSRNEKPSLFMSIPPGEIPGQCEQGQSHSP